MFKMSTIVRNALWHFPIFFPNSWEFLVQILHAYYTFIYTLEYKFLFSYLQLQQSYACHSKCDHAPSVRSVDGGHFEHIMVVALNME